jgi:predicted phage terminase large subunit-like protein
MMQKGLVDAANPDIDRTLTLLADNASCAVLCSAKGGPYTPRILNGHRFPSPKQSAFLLLGNQEALYGGAAGGGKSAAILAAALQYVDQPGYDALILRRTFAQLAKPGALLDMAHAWLGRFRPHVRWNGAEHKWTFPSGATLSFGHMESENAKYDYQGASWHFVGCDELSQFTETQYRYMFSRLRKPADSPLPVRMRGASNPGGVGHEWVKTRFAIGKGMAAAKVPGRVFVPARLEDNPGLNRAEYEASLAELDPITRAQLLAGDWDVYEGGRFKREWFRRYEVIEEPGVTFYKQFGKAKPVDSGLVWRYCCADPAASEKDLADHTAAVVVGITPDRDILVLDVLRKRLPVDEIPEALRNLCQRWQASYLGIESVAFQIAILRQCQKLPGCPPVTGLEPQGKGKLVRATPAIIACQGGQVYLPLHAPWLDAFEGELVRFTGDEKADSSDDQVDAFAYAVQQRDRWAPAGVVWARPERRERDLSNASARGMFGR